MESSGKNGNFFWVRALKRKGHSRSLKSFFISVAFLATLAACGGGSGGGSGGSTSPTNTTGTPGTTSNTPTAESLYVGQVSVNLSNFALNANLYNFSNLSTMANTAVASSTSVWYGPMISDSSGNIYAVTNIPPNSNAGSPVSTSVVKFPNATNTSTSLSPSTVISTLPSNIRVGSIAFDGSGNLYLAESTNGTSQGSIVEYTASSGYSTSSTYSAFSQSGGSNCQANASLAFDSSGNLWINENLYNGTNCNSQIGEFNGSGFTLTLNAPNGAGGDPIAFDSHGNLWLVAGPCGGCSPATNGGVYEWTATNLTGGAAPVTVATNYPSGTGNNYPTQPVFDGNGNLWFALQIGDINGSTCNTGVDIEELPSGGTSLSTSFSYGNCNLIAGLAVIPVPTGLPIN